MYRQQKFDDEHRQVYRKHYGNIPIGWHVHHINYNHCDNRPENLIALPKLLHVRIHKVFSIPPERERLELMLKKWREEKKKEVVVRVLLKERRLLKRRLREIDKRIWK